MSHGAIGRYPKIHIVILRSHRPNTLDTVDNLGLSGMPLMDALLHSQYAHTPPCRSLKSAPHTPSTRHGQVRQRGECPAKWAGSLFHLFIAVPITNMRWFLGLGRGSGIHVGKQSLEINHTSDELGGGILRKDNKHLLLRGSPNSCGCYCTDVPVVGASMVSATSYSSKWWHGVFLAQYPGRWCSASHLPRLETIGNSLSVSCP